MRLTLIFVAVLAVSVIVTSLAAWGITYGVSSARVTTMASEFTQSGLGLLQLFDAFVSGLLKSNSALVNNILALERQSGDARMLQTKAQVLSIIGALVNYTTNATDLSQHQMNQVVDTFAGLMGVVFTDFKGVTMTCASDLRSELAGKVSTFLNNFVTGRTNVLQRFQSLQNLGLINLVPAFADPITSDDCLLLGIVCDSAMEFGVWGTAYLTTTGGRLYYCIPAQGAYLTQLVANGSQYAEYRQTWLPDGTYRYKQQCLATQPVAVAVSRGCPLPQSCQCGAADERCQPWFTPYRNYTGGQSLLVSEVYKGKFNLPQVTISYPILNTSAASPKLLAAAATDFVFVGAQNVLGSIPVPTGTLLVALINDTNLTQVAAIARQCAANETAPNPNLPIWSALRSCDPYVREMTMWLSRNRAGIAAPVTVNLSNVTWDIFPSTQLSMPYYTVVGAKDEDTYRTIDASAAKATTQLAAVRTQQLGLVAASGAATQAYMAAIQAANIQQVQAMQDSFVAQMEELEKTSRAELAVSQQSSTAEVTHLMDTQGKQVDALKAKHLDAMATATGWILGVVLAILVGVLLLSAWGTIRVTTSLNNIIGLMEDVADMKVENLEVPQGSDVTEVARIETAFQVLVVRLAEYKSYMPASLFEQVDAEDVDDPDNGQSCLLVPTGPSPRQIAEDGSESGTSGTDSDVRRSISNNTVPGIVPAAPVPRRGTQLSSRSNEAGVPRSPTRKPWRRTVAVLAVNVPRFQDLLPAMNEGAVRSAFSHYVSVIHEVVAKDRGNVDCILGDQVFVTFNAHIPCPDPAAPAAAAALNIQSRLLQAPDRMNIQIGMSFGQAYAGVVGYAKFKSMVTMGNPMKVASMLSHAPGFDTGAIVVDAGLEERLRYTFSLRPVEVVKYPQLAAGGQALSCRIFLLQVRKNLREGEWMYQIDNSPESDWCKLFGLVEKAQTLQEMQGAMFEYLAAHPQDPIALRLRSRLPLWLPNVGVPL
eukprot:EG_transcript_575